MNASTQHIIHRFNLTLESPSTEGALALCDSLPFFLREEVLPELGAWLSRNYPGEAHLRLDKLDLEVDVLAGTSSESELKMRIGEAVSRQFQAALSKALNEAPKGPTPGVQRVTPDRGTVELLCHFLKTGRLPWWAGRVEISELEHRLEKALARERDHLKADLQPLLQNDERVAQRLSTQFSFSSQEALLLLFAPSKDWERWKADAYILLRLSTQWTGEALTEGLPPLKETLLRQMARQAFRQAAAGKALSATPEMPARIWIRTMARRLPQAISPSSARQSFNEGGAFWRYAIEKWPTRKVSFSLATFKKLLKEEVAQTAKEETSDGFIPDKKATASPTSLAASLDREMKANIPGQAKTTGTEQHSGKTKRRELRHPGRETQTATQVPPKGGRLQPVVKRNALSPAPPGHTRKAGQSDKGPGEPTWRQSRLEPLRPGLTPQARARHLSPSSIAEAAGPELIIEERKEEEKRKPPEVKQAGSRIEGPKGPEPAHGDDRPEAGARGSFLQVRPPANPEDISTIPPSQLSGKRVEEKTAMAPPEEEQFGIQPPQRVEEQAPEANNKNTPPPLERKTAPPNAPEKQNEAYIKLGRGPGEWNAAAIPEEGLYVENAGLVLLHPFLPPLFQKCELCDVQEFMDEESRQAAIHLLHFLATGNTEAPEYELMLNKVLCGLPQEEPVERWMALSPWQLQEAEGVLRSVLEYWPALKTNSIDALRGNFLLRDGKLSPTDLGPKLIVEHKPADILLGSLPWGFGLVKLPWMKTMLTVEWV